MDHTALCFMLIVACAGWVDGNPQPPTTTNASPPTTEESIHMGKFESLRIAKL